MSTGVCKFPSMQFTTPSIFVSSCLFTFSRISFTISSTLPASIVLAHAQWIGSWWGPWRQEDCSWARRSVKASGHVCPWHWLGLVPGRSSTWGTWSGCRSATGKKSTKRASPSGFLREWTYVSLVEWSGPLAAACLRGVYELHSLSDVVERD